MLPNGIQPPQAAGLPCCSSPHATAHLRVSRLCVCRLPAEELGNDLEMENVGLTDIEAVQAPGGGGPAVPHVERSLDSAQGPCECGCAVPHSGS